MSAHHDSQESQDPVEAVVKHIPVVIPVVGAVLIFLLAFIAVFMAYGLRGTGLVLSWPDVTLDNPHNSTLPDTTRRNCRRVFFPEKSKRFSLTPRLCKFCILFKRI